MATHQLFLSYRSEDTEKVVRALVSAFEGAGLKVWIDVHKISAGANWKKEINAFAHPGGAAIVLMNPPYGEYWKSYGYSAVTGTYSFHLLKYQSQFDLVWALDPLAPLMEPLQAYFTTFAAVLFDVPASPESEPLYFYEAIKKSFREHNVGGLVQTPSRPRALPQQRTPSFVSWPNSIENEPRHPAVDVKLEFDASMSEEDAEEFLAYFRRAAKEVTGREPQITELAGDE